MGWEDNAYNYGVVVGSDYYYLGDFADGSMHIFKYEDAGPSLTNMDNIAGYNAPNSYSMRGMAYDGINILYFIRFIFGAFF